VAALEEARKNRRDAMVKGSAPDAAADKHIADLRESAEILEDAIRELDAQILLS
jgi:hypothetical protein